MNHSNRVSDERAIKTYVPVPEDVPLPPQVDVYAAPTQTVVSDTMIAPVIISANLLLTIIIVASMIADGTTAKQSMLVGAAYFGLSTFGYVVIVTGMATAVINAWQREGTERQRIAAYERVMMSAWAWRHDVERTRRAELRERRGSTEPVQRLSPLNSFVPAYADAGEQAQAEARRWVADLFDEWGAPDRRKLHEDGRLRVRMLGSKRGGGSREAGLWLLRQGIIRKVSGGYAFAIHRFPNRESVRDLA